MDGRSIFTRFSVSTHSRAEAAADQKIDKILSVEVSTHSRAEAAAANLILTQAAGLVSTHSRAEAAASPNSTSQLICRFQHTAARRRLLHI